MQKTRRFSMFFLLGVCGLGLVLAGCGEKPTEVPPDDPITPPEAPLSVNVTSPCSTDTWVEGDTETISWQADGAGGVMTLELYQGETLLDTIIASTPNDGSHQWAVDDCGGGNSSQYRIKVADAANPTCNAYSSYFTIEQPPEPCSLSVTSPTSGATWTEGENRTIAWTHAGASGTVKIELYKSATLLCTIASSTSNDGSHHWTVDDCGGGSSSQYRIKITDSADPACNDYSGYFTIEQPPEPCSLSVTSPTSGATWTEGENRTISWTHSGTSGTVKIELYKSTTLLCTIAASTPNDGSHQWAVDDCGGGLSSQYRIKVTDAANPTCNAYSGYFSIQQPPEPCSISVTSPTSGVTWTEGENRTIAWTHSGASGTVKIELYRNTTLQCTIAASTPNDGSHQWAVDDCEGGDSSQYRVKVTDTADPTCNDYSEYFTIKQPPEPCSISVTDPTSGATWSEGENRTISWTYSGASGTVKIELYKSTTLLCTIAASTPNDGSHQWAVDDCGGGVSSQYRIKVTDSADPTCNDYSGYFTITTGSGTSYRKVYQQGVDGYTGCEDTYMIRWKPDLKLEGEIFIESQTDDGREPAGGMRPLIKFNQLGLAGRAVQACTLQLYCYLVIGDDQVLQLHEVLRDWDADYVTSYTYNNGLNWGELGCGVNDVDARSSPVSSIVDSYGEMQWRSFPLPTWLVQQWADSPGDRNNGLLLWAPEFGPAKDRSFRSAEMFATTQRPRLIVHYEDD